MEKQIETLKSQITTQEVLNNSVSGYQQRQEQSIKTQQEADKSGLQYMSNSERRAKAIEKENSFLKAGAITADEYARRVSRINDMYKDPKQPKERAYTEDAGTRLLDQLRQQQQVLLDQAGTGEKIGAQQQALIKWEQQLADIKSKGTLTADQKSLLANADIISAQYEQNAALERQIATREKLLALDKARADISRTIANRESQYATDELFASGGLSQNAQQEYTQRLSLEQSYNDKITQLRQQRATATSDIAREEIDQEIQLQQQAMTTELSMYDAHMDRMNAARGSFTAGASRAWQEYQDSAANVSQMSQQLFSNAFSGMEDSLVSFVVNGKASFKDFANSVLSDIARILARQALVGIGTSLAGSLFSAGVGAAAGSAAGAAGSSAGGLGMSTDFHAYAKGGVPGGSTISDYRNGVYDSPQFFKFGEAGPEAIMPLTRSSDGSLGVRMVGGASNAAPVAAAPQVNVYIQSDGSATSDATSGYEQFGKSLSNLVKTEYQKMLARDIQPGGVIWNLNKGRG
jgi:lambda family phage tail tape measure protein